MNVDFFILLTLASALILMADSDEIIAWLMSSERVYWAFGS
jgi:hypothetical protein